MENLVKNFYKKIRNYNIAYSKYEFNEDYNLYLNNISSKINNVFSLDILEKPECVIFKSYKTEGGIFESSRHFNYGIMFYQDYVIIYRIVETSGWNKEFDFNLKIDIDDLLNASTFYENETLHLQLNLHKNYIQNLKFSNPETTENLTNKVYEKGIECSFLDQTSLRLLHFVDEIKGIPIIVDFLNLLKEERNVKLSNMSSIFNMLDNYIELLEEDISNYPFKDDASYLYLQSKCFKDEKCYSLLYEAFNKVLNNGSGVNDLDKLISQKLLLIDKSFKSELEQLELLRAISGFITSDSDLVDNQISKIEKSLVTQSLNKLNNLSNKVLVLNQEGKFLKSNKFISFPEFDIPNTIQFPPGHPISNKTYLQHPILVNKYLPVDEYESTILKDKIDEFKILVQALGAISVEYEHVENVKNNNKIKTTENTSVEGRTNVVGGSFDLNSEYINSLNSNSSSNRKEYQEFHPMGMPYIPNNLIWFHHEISWQRLAQQRLEGNVLSHAEIIEISKSDSIHTMNMEEIEAEIRVLVKGIDIKRNTNQTNDSLTDLSKKIYTRVKFANIFDIKNINNISTNELGINSNNIFDLFIDFVNKNGKLSKEGVDIFTHFVTYLNIDTTDYEEFLKEIDKSQLTEYEKQYIEMYKLVTLDIDITERERGILNTYAKKLDLSIETQNYLEKLS
jgi:hypothetical protein